MYVWKIKVVLEKIWFFASRERESILFLSRGKIEKVKRNRDIKKGYLDAFKFHVSCHTIHQCSPCWRDFIRFHGLARALTSFYFIYSLRKNIKMMIRIQQGRPYTEKFMRISDKSDKAMTFYFLIKNKKNQFMICKKWKLFHIYV